MIGILLKFKVIVIGFKESLFSICFCKFFSKFTGSKT